MIYDLNETRLQNLLEWLFLQRKFNFAKIRLYFHKINNDVNKVIAKIRQEKFDESFVEIIQYKSELKDFCQTTNKNLTMDEMCKKSYNTHFSKVRQKHEKINTNDCYLSLKYVYEYVSNYDFDEFIFPRHDYSLNQSNLLNSYKNISMPEYDMYKYAKYLHDLFGGAKVSFLHFENTFMLINYRNLLNNILNYTYDNATNKSIVYKNGNSMVQLKLDEKDTEMIETFWKRVIPFIDSLNEKNRLMKENHNGRNSFLFNTKWNNAYTLRTMHRAGKSIYFTDNTLTVNVHAADNILNGTQFKTVPFNYGFLSHFRSDFNVEGGGKVIGFNRLKYDLEYYLFFSSLFV